MSPQYVLALDQGTTSSRAIVFNRDGRVVSTAQRELSQLYPHHGHVEHDPEEIWQTQIVTARQALAGAGLSAANLAAIGVANQRETTLIWERGSGRPVANAIVWQSRVTAPMCDRLNADGQETMIRSKTGLVIDAYCSATKLAHLLDFIDGLRARAARGDVLFGTVDSFLIWRLTGGRCTSPTSAARAARCSSTSTRATGTTICSRCSTSRARCCQRCDRAAKCTASRMRNGSAARCGWREWPVTSRRRCSVRRASRPARRRTQRCGAAAEVAALGSRTCVFE